MTASELESWYDSESHNAPLVHKARQLIDAEIKEIGFNLNPEKVWDVIIKPLAYKTRLEASVLDRALDLYAEDYFGCMVIAPSSCRLEGSNFEKARQSWIQQKNRLGESSKMEEWVLEEDENGAFRLNQKEAQP